MPDYYNTNREAGAILAGSRAQAQSQQELVLKFFQEYHGVFAPHAVWRHVFTEKVPLTSVRRAITNLTIEGKLIKTNLMYVGLYGKLVHGWKLANGTGAGTQPSPRSLQENRQTLLRSTNGTGAG